MINKYEQWYNNIIEKAKNREFQIEVGEKHHIIPKSLGGSDETNNLVVLTLREHFICHVLLTKFKVGQEKYKMIWALHRMAFSEKYKITSRMYEEVRKQFVTSLKNNHPSKSEIWRKKVSEAVFLEWQNNFTRRYETSQRMKKLWSEGKLLPKKGSENGMFGKEAWNKNKKFPGTGKSGKENPSAKKYIICTPTGEQIFVECLKTFCDENNLNYACMKKVSEGKNKQHRGYTILRKGGHQ